LTCPPERDGYRSPGAAMDQDEQDVAGEDALVKVSIARSSLP